MTMRNMEAGGPVRTWGMFLLLVTVSFAPWASSEEASTAVETRLRNDVRYLASDELEGRGVGSKGLDLAAEYIRSEFQKAGLRLDLVNGGPYQTFEMKTSAEIGAPNELVFTDKDGTVLRCELNKDFTPVSFSGNGELQGELVFCGYGIDAADKKYQDFEGIDLKGKTAVIMRRNPTQGNPHGAFQGSFGQISRHAELNSKLREAVNRGAKAVIIVDDPYTAREALKNARKSVQTASKSVVEAATELVAIADKDNEKLLVAKKKLTETVEKLKRQEKVVEAGETDALMDFGYGGQDARSIPILHVTRRVIDQLLKKSLKTDLSSIEQKIDETLKPQSAPLTGWTLKGVITIKHVKNEVKNIIASLDGTSDETVVIGAHYDHVGRGGQNSLAPGSKEIHNGADDNASGSAGLLELARELGAHKGKLKRRILFIAFTAEENGLIGSAHYVAHPVIPLDKTVAMLNLDMVGRMTDNKLSVFGTKTSPIWEPALTKLCTKYDFKLNSIPAGTGPSDQTSFYLKKIPVLHFFTGTHSDYHRPSDDWEKINVPAMRRVVSMIAEIAVDVANADKPPEFTQVAAPVAKAKEGSRPYFGSIPDFSSDQPGYSIGGAAPGSPAEKGGLKAGDRIIKLGDNKIENLEDFDVALRKFKPGETINVTVKRKDDEVLLKVTVEAPR
ncbi:MAG: M20/M25/M40 family metallo-hydrolase [Planctomycetales bacterium]